MRIVAGKKIGHITKIPSGSVREWRQFPGDDRSAIFAAAHYAKKNKQPMVVVPGNSYGRAVLHVALATGNLSRYAPGVGDKTVAVYYVSANGEAFEAIATER